MCVGTDIALAELWRRKAQSRQQELQLLFSSQRWQRQGLRHKCAVLRPPDAKHPGTALRGLLLGAADWLKKKQTPSCSQSDPRLGAHSSAPPGLFGPGTCGVWLVCPPRSSDVHQEQIVVDMAKCLWHSNLLLSCQFWPFSTQWSFITFINTS